eukprot:279128_1
MVIKTESCFYSELKIYPGHGKRFVRKDGKLLIFLNNKCASMYKQGTKPSKLTWTLAWRRLNKKIKTTAVAKRRRKVGKKTVKGVEGISIDDLRMKRSQGGDVRHAQRQENLRDVKERRRKDQDRKRTDRKKQVKAQGGGKQIQKQFAKKSKGGGGRMRK